MLEMNPTPNMQMQMLILWMNKKEDKPTRLLEKKWAHYGPMEVKVKDRRRSLNEKNATSQSSGGRHF
jgi:hypothetical protein